MSNDREQRIMSKRDEKISAYLDGEIHRDEVMSFSLSGEADDAKKATSYRLIGDALRDEVSEASFIDVSAAVRESLANENLEQQSTSAQPKTASDAIMSSPTSGFIASLFHNGLRPLAGMAMAVTVAVVMVLTVTEQDQQGAGLVADSQQVQSPNVQQIAVVPVNSALIKPVANTSTAPLGAAQVNSAQAIAASNTQTPNAQEQNTKNANGLNPYLNEHFATQGTLQSRMPYVRAVSYETKK